MLSDIRQSLRLLRKEKAFTSTVLLTLAVCVGANAAVFSVVHTVVLKPLPYEDAGRLVTLYNSYPGAGVTRASNGSTDFFYRRERLTSFESIAQFQSSGSTVGEPGGTERVSSMRVTPSFFPTLRVQPVQGRNFTEAEMDPGNERVVILSHAYWLEKFGGDPGVLGRDLRIDGRPYQIVGILPADFRVPQTRQPRFYVPIAYPPEARTLERWHSNNFQMIGRLRPGVPLTRAIAENDALNAAMIEEWSMPNAKQLLDDAGYHTVIVPMLDDIVADVRSMLYLFWGGAIFVLLIGCVNIASLILARSHVRLKDTATRLAIGAPRRRLVREMLTQSLVLAVLGGGLGVLVGLAGIRGFAALGADQLPRGAEIAMDPVVLLFTLGLALAAGLLFGAIPAARLLRTDLRSVLQTESRGGTAGRETLNARTALVTLQVALAFLLLIGAGLMLVSFRAAMAVRPGFQPEGVLTALLSLPGARYGDIEDRIQFTETLVQEVRSLPGVRSVGITSQLPFSGNNSSSVILPEGYMPPAGESLLSPYNTSVVGDYFQTMGIPLREGRFFEPADGMGDRRVIILDEWLARRYFGDASPLGRRMVLGVPPMVDDDDYYTVVGVVGRVAQNDLTADPAEHVGAYYLPYRSGGQSFLSLVVSAAGDPAALVASVRERLNRLDPELPLFDVLPMQDRLARSLTGRRASMFLLITFGAVALFLAVLGIYGVLAYAVAQRTREMGIRIALGSTTRAIFLLVLRHGARVAGFGLALGAVAALFTGRLLQSLVFGVEPLDPRIIGATAVLLGATALAAAVIPAVRATRVHPVRAISGDAAG